MPIKACADRLKRELETYGNPPVFPDVDEAAAAAAAAKKKMEADDSVMVDPTQFKSAKTKLSVKTGKSASQWGILKSMGIPEAEIPSFADAAYWLSYFPPRAQADLRGLGCAIDWRRSFITTDVNPYYDAFVRWQFRKLDALGLLEFGERLVVFSPKDDQPCMDHDRSKGEGVGPQDYTLIKLRVCADGVARLPEALRGKKDVFLVAATMRPETMYGQTNCFVLPSGEYGAFEMMGGEVFICSARSARNMSYQRLTEHRGEAPLLTLVRGEQLIGLPLEAPLAVHARVFVLPMFTVSMKKGTGIVTSVPSDSPDDWMALSDVRKKAALQEKFGITPEMLAPEPVPIIEIPGLGDCAAPRVCAEMKIAGQNDAAKLKEAKEKLYMKGFNEGVLKVGAYAGRPVKEVKTVVRDDMVRDAQAVLYAEPNGEVVSRSGDECVVAFEHQWVVKYSDEDWKKRAHECVDRLDAYADFTRAELHATIDYLNGWACSRTYGLGTRLPRDEKYLIDSLSDSTIYNAYYTIAHLLQSTLDGGSPDGQVLPVGACTDAFFDYVFGATRAPEAEAQALQRAMDAAAADADADALRRMRREFEFWYPTDLRVSGKDLVKNHLTFYVFNHVALFPEERWPRGIRSNGHTLLNGDKMSKNTGNFITLEEALQRYTADSVRYVLAEAGDSPVDDGNVDIKQIDAAILRLYELHGWMKDAQESLAALPARAAGERTLQDRAFEAVLNKTVVECTHFCERGLYQKLIALGVHELINARAAYQHTSTQMDAALVQRYLETQLLLLAPFCPHFSDHLWRQLLGHPTSICVARWPQAEYTREDAVALDQQRLFERTMNTLRNKRALFVKKAKAPPAACELVVSAEWPQWYVDAAEVLRAHFVPERRDFADACNKEVAKKLGKLNKNKKKTAMSVIAAQQKRIRDGEDIDEVLSVKAKFNPVELFESLRDYVVKELELQSFTVSIDKDHEHNTTPIEPVCLFAGRTSE